MNCANCRNFRSRNALKIRDHQRAGCSGLGRWKTVVDLRNAGKLEEASVETSKILGTFIKVEPMSEEKKREMREYNKKHAKEIAERRRKKREEARKLKESIKAKVDKRDKKFLQRGK